MNHLILNCFFAIWTFFLNYLGTVLLYDTLQPQTQGKELFYKPVTFLCLGLATFSSVYKMHPAYPISSLIFASLMFINIRTDAETSLLSRFTTIYPVPLFVAAAYFQIIPISFIESIIGVTLGYGFLFFVRWLFFRMTKQEGLGFGDIELAALIGSFLGPLGVWFSIIAGSISGIIFVMTKRTISQKNIQRIPFAPFLCIAALLFYILHIDQLCITYLA